MITNPFPDLHGADAYELLGVHPDASTSTIQRAYHQRMKATHPDTHPTTTATEQARLLNIARDILTHHRTAYDAHRRATFLAWETATPPAASPPTDDPWTGTEPGPPPSLRKPAPSEPSEPVREVNPHHVKMHTPRTPRHDRRFHQARRRTWPTATIAVLAGVAAIAIWTALAIRFNPPQRGPMAAVPNQWAGTWTGEMTYNHAADHIKIHVHLYRGLRPGHITYDATGSTALIPVHSTHRTLTTRAGVRRVDGTLTAGTIRVTHPRVNRVRLVFNERGSEDRLATAKLRRRTRAND